MAPAALAIAEIIHEILSHVKSYEDLARCARVNQQWKEQSLKNLWFSGASLDVLLHLWRERRLELYLPLIRRHHMVSPYRWKAAEWEAVRQLLESGLLTCANTIELVVRLPLVLSNDRLVHYVLQPCLRILDLGEGSFGDDLLDAIEVSGIKARQRPLPLSPISHTFVKNRTSRLP